MQAFPISRLLLDMKQALIDHLGRPEKLVLISLGCEQPGQPVCYEIFHTNHSEDLLIPASERRLLDTASWKNLLNGNKPVCWKSDLLPPEWQEFAPSDEWLVLPLSVFSAPIGFLLIPALSKEKLMHEEHFHIYWLLLDAMLKDLDACFSDVALLKMDKSNLYRHFGLALLPWLAPWSHAMFEDESPGSVEEVYFLLWESPLTVTRFTFGAGAFHLEYRFPCGPYFTTRSAVWNFLRRYFEQSLYIRWERLHQIPDRKSLEEKIAQVSILLNELINDVRNIPQISAPISPDLSQKDFCFYLPKGQKDWTIRFKGEHVTMMSDSQRNVGLEAIRILLQHPNRTFDALELYGKNRFTKGQRSKSEKDNEENKKRKNELLRRLDLLKDALMDNLDNLEIAKVWRLRLEVLMILIEHEPQNKFYRYQYSEAVEKSEIVKSEPNFNVKKFKIFNDLKPTGNQHNAATSLQKGIDAAIDLLSNDELRLYLEKTLIRIRQGQHEPFKYVPGFNDDSSTHSWPEWDTGDPVV